MANGFEAGVCAENWWNNNQSRSPIETSAYSEVLLSDMGSFRWSAADMAMVIDMKASARSTSNDNDDDDDQSAFVCDNSIMEFQKSHPDDSDWMLGFGSSSPTSEWSNQMLLEGTEKNESTYNSMLQEDISSSNFSMESTNTYIYPSSTSTVLQRLFEPLKPSVFDSYQSPNKPETKQQSTCHWQYSNNTPFWNAALAAAAVDNEIQRSFLSSHHSMFEEKPSCTSLTTKPKTELQVSIAMKTSNEQPAFKRPRIESPLPTFKVRKEKLGDRVTALQQLVSPFGKNDTASVLHEAIDYIKFLHDQVNVLSTPYMKNGAHIVQHQQISNKANDSDEKKDLRSKGLCLVPISSTYSVANETAADFWTPTFTGNFM